MIIFEVALNINKIQTFYYKTSIKNNLPKRGFRVLVPFLNKIILGIVLRVLFKSKFNIRKIKKIKKILDYKPIFSENLLSFLILSSKYYHVSLGKILFFILPKEFQKKKNIIFEIYSRKNKHNKNFFCKQQNENFKPKEIEKIKKINSKKTFIVWILIKIEKSKKIEIYKKIIKNILKKKKQILILVPEINLIKKIAKNLNLLFKNSIEIWHSKIKKKKINIWINVKIGMVSILIGTRSSLFNDFKNLGLIIVDEEHNKYYTEKKYWNYNARDLAILRAKQENIPIILTSNTPSLETILNIKKKKYICLDFQKKKKTIKKYLIDIKKENYKQNIPIIVIKKIKKHLKKKNKIILFLNRKGYSFILMCHKCKWKAKCNRCDHAYTVYKKNYFLYCNCCKNKIAIFKNCKNCGSTCLSYKGLGTEKLEKMIKKIFKKTKTIKIEKISVYKQNKQIIDQTSNIFIGTEKILKKKCLKNVNLIVLFNIDQILFSNDFRTIEKFLQFYHQMLEKYSEKEKLEIVLLTKYPEHKTFNDLLNQEYYKTAKKILKERKEMDLPPYVNYIIIQSKSYKKKDSLNFLNKICIYTKKKYKIDLIGPIKENKYKKNSLFRWKIIFQHTSKYILNNYFTKILSKINKYPEKNKVKWKIKFDP